MIANIVSLSENKMSDKMINIAVALTWYCWLSCSACSSCCSRQWSSVSVHSSHSGWSTLLLSLNMSKSEAVTHSLWDMALACPLSPTSVNPLPFPATARHTQIGGRLDSV